MRPAPEELTVQLLGENAPGKQILSVTLRSGHFNAAVSTHVDSSSTVGHVLQPPVPYKAGSISGTYDNSMSNTQAEFQKIMARMASVTTMPPRDNITPVESTNHIRVCIPETPPSLNLTPSKPLNLTPSKPLNLTPSKPFNLSVEDIETVKEENKRIDGAAVDLSVKLAHAVAQVARLEEITQARISELTCRISELEGTNLGLEQTNSGLKMRNSELVAIHVGLNLHMSNSEIFRSELESRNLELVESISELESRNLELVESNSELGVYTTDLNTRMTNLHACVTARETELAGQTGSMEELVRIHNAQIQGFLSQIADITRDNEARTLEVTELTVINTELASLLRKVYEDTERTKTENEGMAQCLQEAHQQLQVQHEEMPVEEQEFANTLAMYTTVSRKTTEMRMEYDTLKVRIDTMKTAMTTMLTACNLVYGYV